MDPGPFIAFAFALPAIIAAVGAVWLGSRALNVWTQRRGRMHEVIERLDAEIGEIQERLDFHERLLKEHHERAQLDRE